MSVKTGNGILNFFYRIFIDVEDVDNSDLRMDSSDTTEAELAKAQAEADEKYKKHFSSSNGNVRNQLKVEKSELNKEPKEAKKEVKQKSNEDRER